MNEESVRNPENILAKFLDMQLEVGFLFARISQVESENQAAAHWARLGAKRSLETVRHLKSLLLPSRTVDDINRRLQTLSQSVGIADHE